MSNHKKSIHLSAFDTLFFRESRPFEAIGGSELASVFPPPARTVMGAIRHTIGESQGVDWHNFGKEASEQNEITKKVRQIIGYGSDDLGQLSLDGLWLSKGGERLYPAPHWLLSRLGPDSEYARLSPGSPVRTHLGSVKLPSQPDRSSGFRSMEHCWFTQTGLEQVLAGKDPEPNTVCRSDTLFHSQPRIGIARENRSGTVQSGLLYQSNHVRPTDGLVIEADFQGLPETFPSNSVIRLGAEGRMASMTLAEYGAFPLAPKPDKSTVGLIITLLSPALFQSDQTSCSWLPPGFKQTTENGVVVWEGEINSVELTLHCAVLGKALREGGWDMAKNAPHPVSSLIPAGSGYFCTLLPAQDICQAIEALHGRYLGEETKLGRGRIACGLWNKNN